MATAANVNEHGKEEAEKSLPVQLLTSESSADYIKSWPVELLAPNNSLYTRDNRPVRRKSYRFKYSCLKNWLVPLDGPLSMDHVHFLLDCFVVSAGPVPPQLGRYHPQSDPEEFVRKEQPEDTWSSESDEEDNYWPKVGSQQQKDGSSASSDAGPSSMLTWDDEDIDEFTFESYFPSTSAKTEPRRTFSPSDYSFSDDLIVRELSEMRLVLERLLDNHEGVDWMHPRGLQDVLDLLPDEEDPQLPIPHYPVGEWAYDECGICMDIQWFYRRSCCRYSACSSCLQNYFSSKIENGQVKIECCNTQCNAYVHRDEISDRLNLPDKKSSINC